MSLSELGIEDAMNILRGSVPVVYTADGPLLGVPSLSDDVPAPARLVVRTAAPPTPGGCFDLGLERLGGGVALGGRVGAFASGGSRARFDLDPDGERRRVLRLRCAKEGGPCGLWADLFETGNLLERTYLDATGLATLAFWARVTPADAGVRVKAADAAWYRAEDALSLGLVSELAAGGEGPAGWRRVLVPLDPLPESIARDSLASIVFEAMDEGETELELAGAQLCRAGARPGPLPAAPPLRGDEPVHRALWVWNTRELLADPEERAGFLEFVEGRFDRVFLHVPPAADRLAEAGFVPFDGERLGRLVAELGERGARVYALDGDPSYVLPENHPGVLGTVEALVLHNRSVPSEQRFHGIRYDVEPYLVPGWAERRVELLGDWLDLLAGIEGLTRPAGLVFGVDIPFWLDNPEPPAGEPVSLDWRGERRSAVEHMVGLVDDLAVMDYRTSAYGRDGSLLLTLGELEVAGAAGARVYVGIETGALLDEDLSEFEGPPSRGLPPEGEDARSWVVVESLDGGADNVRVWLVPPGGRAELSRELERRAVPGSALVHFPARVPIRIEGDRLSFRRLGQERMEAEAARLLRELGDHPAFAGLAYHHYGAMREMEREAGGR